MIQTGIFDVFHIRYNAAHSEAEKETFPFLKEEKYPTIITYTATRWAQLLKPKYMPEGVISFQASDCYRFVLFNKDVDICLCGPKDTCQMQEAISTLELGSLNTDEKHRIKTIGDHVHRTAKSFFKSEGEMKYKGDPMNDIENARCEPCENGAPKLTSWEIESRLVMVPDWEIFELNNIHRLKRIFAFNNFKEALIFCNKAGTLAEEQGHHPAILTEWGKVTITFWTHKIKGLHANDFLMAAKTDLLYK
jgi:4a-hydroxytetrahydrobiopterin dehydratase